MNGTVLLFVGCAVLAIPTCSLWKSRLAEMDFQDKLAILRLAAAADIYRETYGKFPYQEGDAEDALRKLYDLAYKTDDGWLSDTVKDWDAARAMYAYANVRDLGASAYDGIIVLLAERWDARHPQPQVVLSDGRLFRVYLDILEKPRTALPLIGENWDEVLKVPGLEVRLIRPGEFVFPSVEPGSREATHPTPTTSTTKTAN